MLELLDPSRDRPAQSQSTALQEAAVQVYHHLLEHAAETLRRAAWIQLEPADLAGSIYLRLFHPLQRKQQGLIDKVKQADSPELYLRRVVYHAALDEARKRAREQVLPEDSDSFAAPLDAFTWEATEEATTRLLEVLGTLSPGQREVFLLRLAGLSLPEIVKVTGRKYGTAASEFSRALSEIREKNPGLQVVVSKEVAGRIQSVAENLAKLGGSRPSSS